MNEEKCMNRYLEVLNESFDKVVIALNDKEGRAEVHVVNLGKQDKNKLCFVVEEGSALFDALHEQGYVSLIGVNDRVSIKVNGFVLCVGDSNVKGKMLFCIEKGKGEFRDAINHVNEDFIIEEEIVPAGGYYVNDACILCGTCYAVCPKQCIDTAKDPVVIDQSECIQCGECVKVCPVQAIEKK